MPTPENSAAFILTHGRPDRVMTYNLLRASGWTRPIYLIVDDEDKTVPEYRKRYGTEQVIMFSKEEIERRLDIADTQTDRRTITYVRNASFDIARNLGLDYHIQLDDDYNQFTYRYNVEGSLKYTAIRQFDYVFDTLVAFLEVANADAVAFAQGGDLMGGATRGVFANGIKRKAMNSFICRTDRVVRFVGRMNEDVNTYTTLGSRGHLFFTIPLVSLNQMATQSQDGGISELYRTLGTYMKSFYTVMMAPSFVKVSTMGVTQQRMHHVIRWDNAVPKIISDRYRKPDVG
jgi:hypothetical protein